MSKKYFNEQPTPFKESKIYGLVQLLGIAIVVIPVVLLIAAVI